MTVAEIKKTMTDAFVGDPDIIEKYGLEEDKTFEEQFRSVSVENILFFVVASVVWLCFQLFDLHKADVTAILSGNKAHRNQWYATMAKQFRFGHSLIPGADRYDDEGLSDAEIEASRVVKYAAAVQPRDKSMLYIKVATETDGQKRPLPAEQLTALRAYLIDEIPDAGVRITIVNEPADQMRLELDIYYNALLIDASGRRLDGTADTPVQDAVREYLGNLDFNGVYTNQALVDALQKVDGVVVAELRRAAYKYGSYTDFITINAKSIPHAGYYAITDANLILNFIPNEEYL